MTDWISELSRSNAGRLMQEITAMDRLELLIRRECDIADELAVLVIQCEEIIHTDERPFCPDWKCPCHFDEDYVWEHHTQPYRSGLLTWEEAGRLLYGKQV